MLAVGNPRGLQSCVTDGIISALGRDVSESQGVVLPDPIQTPGEKVSVSVTGTDGSTRTVTVTLGQLPGA